MYFEFKAILLRWSDLNSGSDQCSLSGKLVLSASHSLRTAIAICIYPSLCAPYSSMSRTTHVSSLPPRIWPCENCTSRCISPAAVSRRRLARTMLTPDAMSRSSCWIVRNYQSARGRRVLRLALHILMRSLRQEPCRIYLDKHPNVYYM